jgi:hypothetical protein
MFNLIVKSIPWAEGHDSFPRDRLLEETENELAQQFNPAFTGNWEALKSLPTLFVAESSNGNEMARVGTINNIHQPRRDVELEYSYDPLIPGHPEYPARICRGAARHAEATESHSLVSKES